MSTWNGSPQRELTTNPLSGKLGADQSRNAGTDCVPPLHATGQVPPGETPTNPGHVVMYLGNGQVIQAKQTGEPVQADPVDLASVVVATRPADLASQP